ncbi:MAG: hypothetical protein ACQESK_03260 [Bacteroidota bacterium]
MTDQKLHNIKGLKVFIFCLLVSLASKFSFCQTKTYRFNDEAGLITEQEIRVELFHKEKKTSSISNNKGEIILDEKQIQSADSIHLAYGFYQFNIDKSEFKSDTIHLQPQLELDNVIVEERTTSYLGPDKYLVFGTLTTHAPEIIGVETKHLEDRVVIGVRYKFLKRLFLVDESYTGSRFKVILLGIKKMSRKIEEEHIVDLLPKTVEAKVSEKEKGWVTVIFDQPIVEYENYEYLAFGFEPLDGQLHIKLSKWEDYNYLTRFRPTPNYTRTLKSLIFDKTKAKYSDTKFQIERMQLILK